MSRGDSESGSGVQARAGLYLHLPFCSRICPYCDFAVRTGRPERKERFVQGLLAEIGLNAGYPGRFDTVYLGGGTPSSLAPAQLERILAAVGRELSLADRASVFFEANPEDVDREALKAWRALGVGTLSLGIQSFDDPALVFLGRRHDGDAARRSVRLARETGFETVSLDLIYGLPGQSLAEWRRDLEEAVRLAPDHLSCYQLTVHEGTYFGRLKARGRLSEASNERQAELFEFTHRFLAEAGYPGYEVSNFARSVEHQSRHNQKYWQHAPYLGLGPSAHSLAGNRRWWNLRGLDAWQDRVSAGQPPVEASETLGPRELALEALMLGLRTYAGVDFRVLRARLGTDLLQLNRELVDRLLAERLLTLSGDRLQPTLTGLAVADRLAACFDLGERTAALHA